MKNIFEPGLRISVGLHSRRMAHPDLAGLFYGIALLSLLTLSDMP